MNFTFENQGSFLVTKANALYLMKGHYGDDSYAFRKCIKLMRVIDVSIAHLISFLSVYAKVFFFIVIVMIENHMLVM